MKQQPCFVASFFLIFFNVAHCSEGNFTELSTNDSLQPDATITLSIDHAEEEIYERIQLRKTTSVPIPIPANRYDMAKIIQKTTETAYRAAAFKEPLQTSLSQDEIDIIQRSWTMSAKQNLMNKWACKATLVSYYSHIKPIETMIKTINKLRITLSALSWNKLNEKKYAKLLSELKPLEQKLRLQHQTRFPEKTAPNMTYHESLHNQLCKNLLNLEKDLQITKNSRLNNLKELFEQQLPEFEKLLKPDEVLLLTSPTPTETSSQDILRWSFFLF